MEFLKVVLTALLSAAALFLTAKIMGHKQMSQLDFFDYITGITIGSIAAELATELEEPWKPLIAMIVYGVLAFGLSVISSKFPRIRKFINGTPTIVMNNGKLYRKNMKKAKLDLSEFMAMCRQEGYFNLNDIQTAVFEYNGRLTILDLIAAEVIMDGRILEENLKRMGLDRKWLQKQLSDQGYQSAKNIFLGVCDNNHTLSLYKGE